MHERETTQNYVCTTQAIEAQHRPDATLDDAMILLGGAVLPVLLPANSLSAQRCTVKWSTGTPCPAIICFRWRSRSRCATYQRTQRGIAPSRSVANVPRRSHKGRKSASRAKQRQVVCARALAGHRHGTGWAPIRTGGERPERMPHDRRIQSSVRYRAPDRSPCIGLAQRGQIVTDDTNWKTMTIVKRF